MTFTELLNQYHIMPQFQPSVLRQTEEMPKAVSDMDLRGRCDLTDRLVVTIDGDDAKDFDDAVSVELMENGNYCLGVHIADVSHYISEDSPLDRCAFLRGTSIYLADMVIPMLPFELSNELCSLKPDEIRLTVSVFMEITPRGKVENYKIVKSFIKSAARLTYNNVTRILDGDEELCTKYLKLVSMLRNMKRLAAILKKRRIKDGALEFTTHESRIITDKSGKTTGVERYPITLSNSIIEEFMLACNVTVAKYFFANGLPCVYRVHEKPELERVERLARVLPLLGVDFSMASDITPMDFQRVLNFTESSDIADVVNYLVLRAMSKARYSEKSLGHFGLAFAEYCHFTSPIRRYPDLTVHRILKASLDGKLSAKQIEAFKRRAVSVAAMSSVTETNAAEAELAWVNVKKAEYMAEHLGERHKAVITHITSSGFFAELENTVEGFVPASTLEDDIYIADENGIFMTGLSRKRKFTVGDTVEIKVAAVDLEASKIDFELTGKKTVPAQRGGKMSKKYGSKKFSREQRQTLRRINKEKNEEKSRKSNARKRAELEKSIFEKAVVFELAEMLENGQQLGKRDKGFIEATLKDMAAFAALPLYRAHIYGTGKAELKGILVSASDAVKGTVKTLSESFGISTAASVQTLAAEYVCAALRHLDSCLKDDETAYTKREREYEALMHKLRKGKRVK